VKVAGIGDLAARDELERVSGVLTAEQALARRELEEHDAEREDVAPAIDLLRLRLLGRHVGELALDRIVAAELAVRGGVRDAEVHELGLPVEPHQDVVGGDVTVHEVTELTVPTSELVGGVQARGGVGDDAHRHLRWDGATALRLFDHGSE
jgi:hypothetical protein